MSTWKIRSVAPAADWWAAYLESDGSQRFTPLAVFASISSIDEEALGDPVEIHEVVGMDGSDLFSVSHAAEANNFRGYFHASEFEVIGESLKSNAQSRFKAGGS